MKTQINNFMLRVYIGLYCVKDLQSAGLLRVPIYSQEERKEHDLFVSLS